MKDKVVKIISSTLAFLLVAMFACMAYIAISAPLSHHADPRAAATVNSYGYVKVFIECVPTQPYLYLGKIEAATDSATTEFAYYQVKAMIDRARREYPATDGIIFLDLNLHTAIAIKFK